LITTLLGGFALGRKALPAEVKRARGTLRSDREAISMTELGNNPGIIPEPPESLSGPGRALWEGIWKEAGGWLHAGLDFELLRLVCEQIEEREQLRALVMASPEQPRLRIGLRELDKAVISGLSSLGLTPTERARLGLAVGKKATKLEEFRQRLEEGRLSDELQRREAQKRAG
jgi:hypothetical protein